MGNLVQKLPFLVSGSFTCTQPYSNEICNRTGIFDISPSFFECFYFAGGISLCRITPFPYSSYPYCQLFPFGNFDFSLEKTGIFTTYYSDHWLSIFTNHFSVSYKR